MMSKHATMRARKAQSKKLKARANAQAFNQSIWSTVAYRHGTGRVNDPTIKSMRGDNTHDNDDS